MERCDCKLNGPCLKQRGELPANQKCAEEGPAYLHLQEKRNGWGCCGGSMPKCSEYGCDVH